MRAQKEERGFSRRSPPISRRSHYIPTFLKAIIALFPVPMLIRMGLHDTANGNSDSRNQIKQQLSVYFQNKQQFVTNYELSRDR